MEDVERKTEDGGSRMENGEWRTENGGRRTEDGERRTENGEQRTEKGEQKIENGELETGTANEKRRRETAHGKRGENNGSQTESPLLISLTIQNCGLHNGKRV